MSHTKQELLEELDYLEGAACLPHSERTDAIREVIEQHFEKEAGGDLYALRGIAPDLTGDLSSEDFVRRIRDKHSAQVAPQAEKEIDPIDMYELLSQSEGREK